MSIKYRLCPVPYAPQTNLRPYLPVSQGADIGSQSWLDLLNEHLILQASDTSVVSCPLIGCCC